MSTNLENVRLINNANERLEKRKREFKESTFSLIFLIGTTIILLIFESYIENHSIGECNLIKFSIIYLTYIFFVGTSIIIFLTAIYYLLDKNSSQRKYFFLGYRIIGIIMIFYYALMIFWDSPEIFNCNYTFLLSNFLLLMLDILFFLFLLKEIMEYFRIIV